MPYIDRQKRAELHAGRAPMTPGELNYAITTAADQYIGPRVSYARINEVIGALECVKLELYRRLAAPYEDGKKAQNGDVYKERT